MDLGSAWGKLRSFLGTWGVLAGLGLAPLPLTAVAWLAGAFGDPTISAIAFSLAASWAAVSTWLAYRYWRRVQRIRNAIQEMAGGRRP